MPKITTFLYHDVTDDVKTSGFQNPDAQYYKHSTAHFDSDIDLILANKPASRSIGKPCMKGEIPEGEDLLLFTLDDGGSSSMHIADVLESKGIHAYFFVTTSMVGNPAFVTKEQIRELVARGHVVGSHSHFHTFPFRALPYEEKVEEWSTSCNILSDILSQPVVTGSIPGGKMDRDTFRAAEQAGMKLLFTSEPTRTIRRICNITAVGRICPKNSTSQQFITQTSRARSFWHYSIFWRFKSQVRHIQYKLKKRKTHRTQ